MAVFVSTTILIDIMGDGELRFVLGHEMEYVVNNHIKKKMILSYGWDHSFPASRPEPESRYKRLEDQLQSNIHKEEESFLANLLTLLHNS